jgi:ferritin-like protein
MVIGMSKLLPHERETIMLFNEAENTAEIETHNKVLKRRLAEICLDFPDDVKVIKKDRQSDVYIFPKKWFKLSPPRKISDKHRMQLENARAKRNAK